MAWQSTLNERRRNHFGYGAAEDLDEDIGETPFEVDAFSGRDLEKSQCPDVACRKICSPICGSALVEDVNSGVEFKEGSVAFKRRQLVHDTISQREIASQIPGYLTRRRYWKRQHTVRFLKDSIGEDKLTEILSCGRHKYSPFLGWLHRRATKGKIGRTFGRITGQITGRRVTIRMTEWITRWIT